MTINNPQLEKKCKKLHFKQYKLQKMLLKCENLVNKN